MTRRYVGRTGPCGISLSVERAHFRAPMEHPENVFYTMNFDDTGWALVRCPVYPARSRADEVIAAMPLEHQALPAREALSLAILADCAGAEVARALYREFDAEIGAQLRQSGWFLTDRGIEENWLGAKLAPQVQSAKCKVESAKR